MKYLENVNIFVLSCLLGSIWIILNALEINKILIVLVQVIVLVLIIKSEYDINNYNISETKTEEKTCIYEKDTKTCNKSEQFE